MADVPDSAREKLRGKFEGMMKALFKEKGASLRVEILSEPEVTEFIDTHAAILDSGFAQVKMSDKMRESLQKSDWMFSGMKTFHELNEAFPKLLDENGDRKPFEHFLNDVRKVDDTYNRHYLRAEYNFAQASAEMAGRWEKFEEEGDEYLLQYRTADDDKVRPEHAELHGVTLPVSDSFWDEYYPPNGWNCRCTVVQVRRDKYPQTNREEAFNRARNALTNDKEDMFRFNPGKQERTFPEYNPYTISKCSSCPKAKNLAAGIPANQLCEVCQYLYTAVCGYEEVPVNNGHVRQHKTQSKDEIKENREIASFLAEKHGYTIDLLPKIDNKAGEKNPDSFNHTLGYKQEYKDNSSNTFNSYDRAIREGRKQASSLVIRLTDDADFASLARAMNCRCKFSKTDRITDITLIWKNQDHTYSATDIVKNGFKIRREDFK